MSFNGTIVTDCFPNFQDQEQEDCASPVGTITFGGETTIICDDHRNECTANNGTYGSYNGMETCLPEDFGDDIPTCDADGHVSMVWDPLAQSGGVVCESPVEPIPDVPGSEVPDEPDTDGDGIPDSEDPDIDGDGIPNSQDDDMDGDGVDNVDDPTPGGDQGDGDSSVGGGKICNSAPQCKGDPIQCAILYQTWKARCDSTEQVGDGEQPGDIDKGDDMISTIDDGLATITGTGDQAVDDDVNALSVLVTGILPSQSSCSDPVISFFGQGQLVISCSKLGDFRDILGWFFYVITGFYLFTLATKPIESKA